MSDIDARRTRLRLARDLSVIQLKLAQLNRQHTEIRAPVSGIVIASHVENHAVVQAGASVAVIEDTSQAEVICHLTMDEMYWVWNHAEVDGPPWKVMPDAWHETSLEKTTTERVESRIRTRARTLPSVTTTVIFESGGEEFEWSGTLSRIDGAGLDAHSRTVPCRIVVENPVRTSDRRNGPSTLMRGMFVACRIRTNPNRPLLTIPERAVRPATKSG